MLEKVLKTEDAYHQLYEGTTILLSLANNQIPEGHLATLVSDVQSLTSNKIRFRISGGSVEDEPVSNGHSVNEIIVISEEGGVFNQQGKLIPLLGSDEIDLILSGDHPTIKPTDTIRRQLEQIKTLLPKVGKAVITSATGLREEIELWRGSGTLCYDSSKVEFGEANPLEKTIFDQVYGDLSAKEIFRARSQKEIDELKQHLRILRVKNSPLGGVCLIPRENNWTEISCLWSGFLEGKGIGTKILDKSKSETGKAFALSNTDTGIAAFKKAGFIDLGEITEAQKTPGKLPIPSLENYDASKRNHVPHLFVFEAEQQSV